jgi:hypothetical protein
VTTVYKAGPQFQILASNSLGEVCPQFCLSTIAVSQGQLFLRTAGTLWVIGNRKP